MPTRRPRVVTLASLLILIASVGTVVEALLVARDAGSVLLMRILTTAVATSEPTPPSRLADLQTVVEAVAYAVVGGCVVVLVLAWRAYRGSRLSRALIGVLVVPLVVGALAVDAYAAPVVILGIALMWTRSAKPWFAVSARTTTSANTSVAVSTLLSLVATVGGAGGAAALLALHHRPEAVTKVLKGLHDRQVQISPDAFDRLMVASIAALGAIAVLGAMAVIVAVFVLRGSPRARRALVGLSVVCAVLSLAALASVVSLIWFAGSIWVTVRLVGKRTPEPSAGLYG